MEKIKVLVANQPRLMRELVLATVSAQPDIDVIGEIENYSQIAEVVEAMHPDCLIIDLDESDNRPHICDALLLRHPQMAILGLASQRNSSVFYWATLNIRSNRVETSEAGILGALRGQAKGPKPAVIAGGSDRVN